MNLTRREKFWYPVIGALIAYVPCTLITISLCLEYEASAGLSELQTERFFPPFMAIVFGPALWMYGIPYFVGFLIQFLVYGGVIGVAWRANKLRWVLIALIIVHLALSLPFLYYQS